MRICIIGNPYGVHDIGERKVVSEIVQALKDNDNDNNEVFILRPRDVLSLSKLHELRAFCPQIVHYWAGPRFQSFVILWIFKLISGARVSLNTAIRPEMSKLGLYLAGYIKPSLVLAQSKYYMDQFSSYGFAVSFFPNGVDTSKFFSVDAAKKQELRARYGIPQDKFVILHVGHITPWRSLDMLGELAADKENYVLIIGSTSLFCPHEEIAKLLKNSGCDVRLEYVPDIAEVYQLSDCYVFPGGYQQSGLALLSPRSRQVPAIEIPLSVLEAAACNLKVVTSRFGGIETCPGPGENIHFFDSSTEIPGLIARLRMVAGSLQTSGSILRYDWKKIVVELTKLYEKLMRDADPEVA